jgi:hypothetical protein
MTNCRENTSGLMLTDCLLWTITGYNLRLVKTVTIIIKTYDNIKTLLFLTKYLNGFPLIKSVITNKLNWITSIKVQCKTQYIHIIVHISNRLDIQVHYLALIVSLSTAAVTGASSHRQPSPAGNLDTVFPLQLKLQWSLSNPETRVVRTSFGQL